MNRGAAAGGLRLDRVRAVSFDVWGTLLRDDDPDASYAARVARVAEHARDEVAARGALDAAWRRHYGAWTEGRASGAFDLARDTLGLLGIDDEPTAVELATAFSTLTLAARVRAVDGARESLAFLHERGLRLGLVCDTGFATGAVVRQLLDREGLGEWLDVQIYSDEWDAPKPHARLFLAVLAGLGVEPGDAVHVGDLRRTDIAGARGAGMGSVRLRAVYDDPDALPDADRVVDSHAELVHAFTERAADAGRGTRLLPEELPDGPERLDVRIREGRLPDAALRALATRLARRHDAARCDDQTSFAATTEKLASEVRALVDAAAAQDPAPPWLAAVDAELSRFLLRHADRLRARVLGGQAKTVHGHLAPSRVSVSDDGRRVWIAEPFRVSLPMGSGFVSAFGDVVRDLVDLDAALRAQGRVRDAERLVAAYAEDAVDFHLYGVLDFQARLQALRRQVWYRGIAAGAASSEQRTRAAAEARIAEDELAAPRNAGGPRTLVATGGLVGTGKSTVSRAAAAALAAPRIEADRLRLALIEHPPVAPLRAGAVSPREAGPEADWERTFAPGFTDAVYAELFRQARRVLASGRPVVLDGCFGARRLRDAARELAREQHARFLFFECRLPREIHAQRITERERRRGGDPDAWAELAADLERRWEAPARGDDPDHHVIDTSREREQVEAEVAALL